MSTTSSSQKECTGVIRLEGYQMVRRGRDGVMSEKCSGANLCRSVGRCEGERARGQRSVRPVHGLTSLTLADALCPSLGKALLATALDRAPPRTTLASTSTDLSAWRSSRRG